MDLMDAFQSNADKSPSLKAPKASISKLKSAAHKLKCDFALLSNDKFESFLPK